MSTINTSLDDVFKSTAFGDRRSAIGTTFFGINHRQTPQAVPINTDGYGLTFFTRPQLNLSTDNIRAERSFIPLLTKNAASIQRIIRCYLDPRLIYTDQLPDGCPFVDNKNAFMPLLTNHLLSCSGWPDPVLETHTSKPGAYKEVFGFADSTLDIYSAYDVSTTFRNMISDPITLLYYTWIKYQAAVFKGIFVPYPDYLVKNEIDYNTRIYRLVLDRTKRFVQKIGCCGAAHPTTGNIGSAFNFEAEKPLNETHERIDIQWRAYGASYNDPILVSEFNRTVAIFNPDMRPLGNSPLPPPSMQAIPMSTLEYLNSRGYPWINPESMELLWYIPLSEFSAEMQALERHRSALGISNVPGNSSTVSFTRNTK